MSEPADLWERVTAFANLRRAALVAARSKRTRPSVARFLFELEPRCFALRRELRSERWRPGHAQRFTIHDPKRRTISAAPFEDRVVHHALMDVLEPLMEARMLPHSFACRSGMGTHAALRHAQRELGRQRWSLKLDILHCFESLRHAVVLESFEACVREPRVRRLLGRIVRAHPDPGLPIGSLTSQWLANLVLNRVDHFVLGELRPGGYVRYMDDFVLFHDDKQHLRSAHAALAGFVTGELGLALKERVTRLAPRSRGLPYLGWSLYPRSRRLRQANARRTRRRMRERAWAHRRGQLSSPRFADCLRASHAHLVQGGARGLSRAWSHP